LVKWQKDGNGDRKKIDFGFAPLAWRNPRFTSHTDIDNDQYIWQQIEDQIVLDLKRSIGS
jgi:hypothetical protein